MFIIDLWNAIPFEARYNWLKADVLKITPMEVKADRIMQFYDFHGLDCLINEGYAHILEITPEALDEANSKREKPLSLATVVWRAAKHAVRTAVYSDRKHDHESLEWLCDDDRSTWEVHFSCGGNQRRKTEEAVINRVFLEEFKYNLDETDKMILAGLLKGWKQNECAGKARISPPAINRRVKKLRMALLAAAI